jgi:sorting nexin-5/6/32
MFKKTVSMHEVFLQRLAAHPVLRNDNNFRVFLEYKEDVILIKIYEFFFNY